jgi:hypothetical protein
MIPHNGDDIHCRIGLYERNADEIARLTAAINRSSTAPERMHAAQDLRACVGVLLAFGAFAADDPNCRLCRELMSLRAKTAAVVEKVSALVP